MLSQNVWTKTPSEFSASVDTGVWICAFPPDSAKTHGPNVKDLISLHCVIFTVQPVTNYRFFGFRCYYE